MYTPDFSHKQVEEKLEERLKYKPFFSTESELALFLRLPLNTDQSRQLYLSKLIEEEKKNTNDGESQTDTVDSEI